MGVYLLIKKHKNRKAPKERQPLTTVKPKEKQSLSSINDNVDFTQYDSMKLYPMKFKMKKTYQELSMTMIYILCDVIAQNSVNAMVVLLDKFETPKRRVETDSDQSHHQKRSPGRIHTKHTRTDKNVRSNTGLQNKAALQQLYYYL